MRHYLSILQQSMRQKWESPALCDYRGETFTFGDIATRIDKLHRLFNEIGLQPGDKISLASKNCARWATAFLAAGTYRAVAVPILPDFTPSLSSVSITVARIFPPY